MEINIHGTGDQIATHRTTFTCNETGFRYATTTYLTTTYIHPHQDRYFDKKWLRRHVFFLVQLKLFTKSDFHLTSLPQFPHQKLAAMSSIYLSPFGWRRPITNRSPLNTEAPRVSSVYIFFFLMLLLHIFSVSLYPEQAEHSTSEMMLMMLSAQDRPTDRPERSGGQIVVTVMSLSIWLLAFPL